MRADPVAVAEELFRDADPPRSASRGSAAQRLAGFLDAAELFHAADGRAYATIEVSGHVETWPIRSKRFRGWLSTLHYAATGKPAPNQAMAEVVVLAEARALAGAERAVFVRVGEADGRVFVDLADPAWRAVEVTAAGWRVVERCPVRFRRAAGMLSLPEPARGGTVEELRPFLTVEDDRAWRLIVAWLLMALSPPGGPYPVLVLGGEHGSGKSWTANRLRDLVDPNGAPSRAEPREPRDLMIAARNSWVLSLDNLSHLPPWLSDGLCRLATGSAFSARELYSDDDEILFSATRPAILNGIGEIITRPDLLDRSLLLTLPPMPEQRRRDERDLLRAYVLGGRRRVGARLGSRDLPGDVHREPERGPRAGARRVAGRGGRPGSDGGDGGLAGHGGRAARHPDPGTPPPQPGMADDRPGSRECHTPPQPGPPRNRDRGGVLPGGRDRPAAHHDQAGGIQRHERHKRHTPRQERRSG